MPKIVLPIEETDDSIVRPVVYDIAREIMELTSIPKDTRIYYPGHYETTLQQGSSINKDGKDIALFNHGNKLAIEVEETYTEDAMLQAAVYQADHPFIFRDDRVETFIRPIYTQSEVTIRFSFRATDKNEAIKWRDLCQTKTAAMRQQLLFSVKYHYPVPDTFVNIITEIWNRRESVAPYGEDFEEYFKKNRTERMTKLVNSAGKAEVWAIPETQQRIQGQFDFTGVPETGSREGDAATWLISFDFKFRYDKAVSMVMAYPIVVHNQAMPDYLMPKAAGLPIRRPEEYARYGSMSVSYLAAFEGDMFHEKILRSRGIAIPAFDEFIPEFVPGYTVRFYTALVQVSAEDPRDVLNIAAASELEIEKTVLGFLKKEAVWISKERKSLFNIAMYEGIRALGEDEFTIDSDLNVRTTFDMDLRKTYHLRFGIYYDWTVLEEDALDRAREEADAVIKIIIALRPDLINRLPDGWEEMTDEEIEDILRDLGLLPEIIGDNYIPKWSLEEIITGMVHNDHLVNGMWTVQSLYVEPSKNASI